MRIKLNENENNLCKEYLLKYLKDICDLETIENKIKSTYSTYIKKDSNIIEVVNDFYSNEDEYKNIIANQNLSFDYFIENLNKLLISDIDINAKYAPVINDNDATLDSFVDNGTLVLKIDRLIDFNIDPIIMYDTIQKMDNYAKTLENFFKSKLNVPVRILFNDIKNYGD